MATTEITKKDVTFEFDGGYTRKVTVSGFAPSEFQNDRITAFRNAVKAFNDSDAALVSSFYGYSTSDDTQTVYNVKGITDANITQTSKTPIYARDEQALARALADDSTAEGE